MAFILCIIALFSVLIIAPVALLFKLMLCRLNSDWLMRIAVSLDQLINVIADDVFNVLLIKSWAKNKFGDEDETVSSVIGKNYLAGSLTKLGLWVRYVLHKLDKNHSVKSIERDENL